MGTNPWLTLIRKAEAMNLRLVLQPYHEKLTRPEETA